MTDDFARAIEAEDAKRRSHLEDLIKGIAVVNEQLKPLEAIKKRLSDELKQEMALGDLEEIPVPEAGVIARIKRRNGPTTYDLVRLAETSEGCEAIVSAAGMGMTRIDPVALERFRSNNGAVWADLIASKAVPGQGTDALYVEELK